LKIAKINESENMIANEFKPNKFRPHMDSVVRLFLAGSIEQGSAEMWQPEIVKRIREEDGPNQVDIFNPRRDDWDAAWPNDPDFPQFKAQVNWEIDYITSSDVVFFWFDPKTKSPITLLELGLVLSGESNVVIYCPKEFYRYGNVKITAHYFGETVHTSSEAAIDELLRTLKKPFKRIYLDNLD
jgi:hypothetical protein